MNQKIESAGGKEPFAETSSSKKGRVWRVGEGGDEPSSKDSSETRDEVENVVGYQSQRKMVENGKEVSDANGGEEKREERIRKGKVAQIIYYGRGLSRKAESGEVASAGRRVSIVTLAQSHSRVPSHGDID